MRKILLLLATVSLAFTGCKTEDVGKLENLEIKLKTGESYRFNENKVTVTTPPNDFVAEVKNNEIKGIREGETQMVAITGDITYNCNVKVTATNTHYIDMAMYLNRAKSIILDIFGEPLGIEDNVYVFGPLIPLTKELNNVFTFNSSDNVESCLILFPIGSGLDIVAHLSDRYIIYTVKDSQAIMGDASDINKCNVIILYDYSKSPIFVLYTTKAELDKAKSRGGSQSTIEILSAMAKSSQGE